MFLQNWSVAKSAKFQVYEDAKDADNFFDKILPLLESDLIDAAAGHDAFIASLVTIARGYSKALTPEAEEEEEGFFFHDSYEKALILIIGMMESSSCLKVFFETLRSQDLVVPFSQALGSILPLDISYTTQVEHTSSCTLLLIHTKVIHKCYIWYALCFFFPCSRRLHWISWLA